MNKKNIALILSGGEGKRFDKKKPKQFFKINNYSILEITVKKFADSRLFKNIVIVCPLNYRQETLKNLKKYDIKIVTGGETRQTSVLNGIKECKKFNPENIVIHDVVRPFFSNDLLKKLWKILKKGHALFPH